MNEREALKLALEALELEDMACRYEKDLTPEHIAKAITAIREALAQPEQEPVCSKCHGLGYYDEGHECDNGTMAGGNYVECDKCKKPEFIKHEVENADDWSDWVCPDPESYLIKCCDCGLVHEAQFRVAKYKPAPSDECEVVSDPDLQAQFRMRRSEQWSPEDTAHRAGGLPMAEQPAQQQEPVAYIHRQGNHWEVSERILLDDEKARGWTEEPLYTSPPASKPLTNEQIMEMYNEPRSDAEMIAFARAIEAAHGIGEQK